MSTDTKGQAAGRMFSAVMRLEVEAMKAQVMRFVTARVEEELAGVVEAACEQALSPEAFRAAVAREVEKAMQEAIAAGVRQAITYNREITDSIERGVKNLARDIVVDRFGRT